MLSKSIASPTQPPSTDQGFFRTLLAGRGQSVRSAFASLRDSRRVTAKWDFPERGLFGARVELHPGEGEGFYEFLDIRDSIFVVTENVQSTHPRLELLPGDGLLSFHVRLAGVLTIAANSTTSLQIVAPTMLVWHQPPGIDTQEWWLPGRGLSVTIFCRPEFIRSALAAGDAAGGHIERYLVEHCSSISYCQLPVTAEIIAAVRSLASSSYDSRLLLLHMEAKALELYCLILSAFDRLCQTTNEQYSNNDHRAIHRAREILSSRFRPIPTIQEIAREVGVNETKLKSAFKTVFGRTMFEYGQLCRMEHAMKLLRDRHMPIGLVAEAVGYSHQTSFASAFKDYFGYQPKEVRRMPGTDPQNSAI